jgi:predicted O-methyltransferase YrrM
MPEFNALNLVKNISQFSLKNWILLLKFVHDWQPRQCLDLGFGHGISTICIASALREIGCDDCHVSAIDTKKSRERMPNVEDLLRRAGLMDGVSIQYEEKSINWAFIQMLENSPSARFDLVNINGVRTWYSMGFAAMMAVRLLKPGGWLILNGVDFTLASSSQCNDKWVRKLPDIEQNTMQVNKVFDLLVKGNDSFSIYRAYGKLYFAQRASEILPVATSMDQLLVESTLCEVLCRAHTDPDFRFDLIWNRRAAAERMPGPAGKDLMGMKFCEGSESVVIGKEFSDKDGTYHLIPPHWHSKMNRAILLEYLASG